MAVYLDPAEGSSSVAGFDLNAATFLVSLRGEKTVRVRKSTYAKNFPELYGDCPQVVALAADGKPKFGDMALHVYAYDRLCGAGAAPAAPQ
jgi:hypothetical protein